MFLQPPKTDHVPGRSSTKTKRKQSHDERLGYKAKRQREFVELDGEVFMDPPSLYRMDASSVQLDR